MYAYIDVLFGIREKVARGGFLLPRYLTTDSQMVNVMPPYLLVPEAFCIAYAKDNGDIVPIFHKSVSDAGRSQPKEILEKLSLALYEVAGVPGNSSTELVGWNLDRIIIPALCTNALAFNVKLPQRYFRRLNHKWAKTGVYSVERAFWQGWYATDHSHDGDQAMQLTLTDASNLTGIDTPEAIYKSMGEGDSEELLLASRLAVISNLFGRYQDLLAPQKS